MPEEAEAISLVATILEGIEFVALGIELLAVGIIVVAIVVASADYFGLTGRERKTTYTRYKQRLGLALLLGLEILVAADIIRTVALEPSLTNVGVLALLVVIRTFLSWSLVVEIEHRWPWQPERSGDSNAEPGLEDWTG